MAQLEALPALATPGTLLERRAETRDQALGTLWMVDHNGRTVLRCQCLDASHGGIRLRAPLGYGIAEGQRYELRSHLPGRYPVEGLGLVGSRWGTIVRTQVRLGADEDHLELGMALDDAASSLSVPPATGAWA